MSYLILLSNIILTNHQRGTLDSSEASDSGSGPNNEKCQGLVLAWILHLVGGDHQPVNPPAPARIPRRRAFASAKVPREERGKSQ